MPRFNDTEGTAPLHGFLRKWGREGVMLRVQFLQVDDSSFVTTLSAPTGIIEARSKSTPKDLKHLPHIDVLIYWISRGIEIKPSVQTHLTTPPQSLSISLVLLES